MMNKILAETLSIMNGFLALATIVGAGILGKYVGPFCLRFYAQLNGLVYASSDSQAEAFGIIAGLAVGLFVAVAVCGLLALLIQMHRELKAIRQQLSGHGPARDAFSLGGPKTRIAPTMGS